MSETAIPSEQISGNAKSPLRQISFLAIADLTPAPHNPRKHSRSQIRAIARSIEAFGFNAPILIDRNRQIVAGHGRYEAAKLLGLTQVPVIFLDHLTEIQAKAYRPANRRHVNSQPSIMQRHRTGGNDRNPMRPARTHRLRTKKQIFANRHSGQWPTCNSASSDQSAASRRIF